MEGWQQASEGQEPRCFLGKRQLEGGPAHREGPASWGFSGSRQLHECEQAAGLLCASRDSPEDRWVLASVEGARTVIGKEETAQSGFSKDTLLCEPVGVPLAQVWVAQCKEALAFSHEAQHKEDLTYSHGNVPT